MFEHVEHVCIVSTAFESSHKRWKEKTFYLELAVCLGGWSRRGVHAGNFEGLHNTALFKPVICTVSRVIMFHMFLRSRFSTWPCLLTGLISCLDHSNWLKSGTLQTKCHVCHKKRCYKRKKTQNSGASFSFFVEIKAISTNTLQCFMLTPLNMLVIKIN